jgi:prepilin-type N-terminal cleavage/methylation domain-containing protein
LRYQPSRLFGGGLPEGNRFGAHAGCTLVENMVVLLILAILLAIAIRTFLGVTNPAIRRATRSDLDTALIAGRAVYSSQILT